MPEIANKGSRFIGRLESMRGIAALFVAIFHSFTWMPVQDQAVSILSIFDVHGFQPTFSRLIVAFTNGAAWVGFFFALSGFVLARSLADSKLSVRLWVTFLVRRVFRIVPPFLASLIVVCALLYTRAKFHLFPNAYDWYDRWRLTTVGWADLVENVTFSSNWINPPSWTLRIELLAALSFPVVFVVMRWFKPVTSFVLWMGMAILTDLILLGYFHSYPEVRKAQQLVNLVTGNFLFLAGTFCALHGDRLMQRIKGQLIAWIPVLSLALIFVPNCLAKGFDGNCEVLSGVGSFALITVLASGRKCYGLGWLDGSLPRFLGRISFSFYLLHYAVLYATTTVLTEYQITDIWLHYPLAYLVVSALISVGICVPLSWIMYEYIERPFTKLGKKASNFLSRKPGKTRASSASVS
jgi:peptidoglycan/LPS O-acetylase OafA/YrhL